MKISELGEFGLIKMLSEIVDASRSTPRINPDLILGIGDDTAAWRCREPIQLATTDILVEGIHFDTETISWHDLGVKSLAVNISDIAAMGGKPSFAIISMGLPQDMDVDSVVQLYGGVAEIARRFNMTIVGGDLTRSPILVISPSVMGETEADRIMRRTSAMPGDRIAVTGALGASAAGLEHLREDLSLDPKIAAALKQIHCTPNPRVLEGQVLAENGVKAAIDISDGLLSDLGHICRESRVQSKIRIEDIPIHPLVKAAFGQKALDLAISGGEDYELLFTAPAEIIEKIRRINASATPITIIGQIEANDPGKVTLIDSLGEPVELKRSGWDHFRED